MDDVSKMTPEEIRQQQERIAKSLNLTVEEYLKRYQTGQFGSFNHPRHQSEKPLPDFSVETTQGRVLAQTAGLPPHERPGHLASLPPSARAKSAVAGIGAVRNFNLDDGIDHT